jgi:hypothetical protein
MNDLRRFGSPGRKIIVVEQRRNFADSKLHHLHTLERERSRFSLVALEPRCDGESENFFSAFSAGQTQPGAAPVPVRISS